MVCPGERRIVATVDTGKLEKEAEVEDADGAELTRVAAELTADGSTELGAIESVGVTDVGLWMREVYDWLELGKTREINEACDDCEVDSDVCEDVLNPVA